MSYLNLTEAVTQEDNADASRERVAFAIVLVIDNGDGTSERIDTNAERAWDYMNDAYDHCVGSFRNLDGHESLYYVKASA